MRKVSLVLGTAVALSLVAQTATAQAAKPWQFGPEVSFGTGSYGPAIGARAWWVGLGQAVKAPGLGAYAAFDYFFPSTSVFGYTIHVWELNINATYDIPHMTGFRPYVGGGLNYANYSVSNCPFGGCASSQTGLNILGGAHFNPSPKLPMFAEARIELRTASFVAFTVGVLF